MARATATQTADKEKATEPTEYPLQPTVAGPDFGPPLEAHRTPEPPGGLLLLPWAPVDSTVPPAPIVISPEAQARSTPIALPNVPPEQATDARQCAPLRHRVPVEGHGPGAALPVAPPGYRLERDPSYRPDLKK